MAMRNGSVEFGARPVLNGIRMRTTEDSLKYFREHKDELGKVTSVSCIDTLFSEQERAPGPFNVTVVIGTENVMLLSGLTFGYRGEGPRGLETLCREAGFKAITYELIVQSKGHFVWDEGKDKVELLRNTQQENEFPELRGGWG